MKRFFKCLILFYFLLFISKVKASSFLLQELKETTNKIYIEQDGPLEIQLSDRSGRLLRKSRVTLQEKTVTTNEEGIAYFEDVQRGSHEIKVQLPKFGGEIERHVTVESSENTQLSLSIAAINAMRTMETDEKNVTPRITLYSTDWGDYDAYWDLYWYTAGMAATGTAGGTTVIASAYAVEIYTAESDNIPSGWTLSISGNDVRCSIPSNTADGQYVFDVHLYSSDGSKTIEVGVAVGDVGITLYVEVIDDYYYAPIIGAEVSGDLGTFSGDYASGYTQEDGYAVFRGLDLYDSTCRIITATHPEYLTVEESYYATQNYTQYLTMYTYPTEPRGNISLVINSAFHPIRNCKIAINGTRYSAVKKTDNNGKLILENMAQDSYNIEVTKAGFQSYTTTLVLNDDNLYVYTPIILTPLTERTVSISIRESNSDNAVTEGFLIVEKKRYDTDAQGNIYISKVPSGTYQCYIGGKNLIAKKIRINVSQENYSNTIYLEEYDNQETVTICSEYFGRFSSSTTGLYIQTTLDKTIARGTNYYGQLGTGNTTTLSSWEIIANNTLKVATGKKHTLLLKQDGTVWTSGNNDNGELGNGTTTDSKEFVQVSGLSNVISIAAGDSFSLALKNDGTVWSWGNNTYGQLGNNTLAGSSVPVQVSYLTSITQIQAGDNHGIALKQDGTVWCWGNNNYGQIGAEAITYSQIPVRVTGIEEIVQISASEHINLCLKNDGTVWGWGSNTYGRLCNGTRVSTHIPVMSPFFTNVKQVDVGNSHCIIFKNNGSVWTMERIQDCVDSLGQLNLYYQPIRVKKLSDIAAIACNDYGNIALRNDGSIITWDVKKVYQFGIGQEHFITHSVKSIINGHKGSVSNVSIETARDVSSEINGKELLEEAITESGQHRYYKFIASADASYIFTTIGSGDTYGYLRDENGDLLLSHNNISTSDKNFKIQKTLEKGKVYYLEVVANSETEIFEYTLSVSCQKTIAGISVQQTVNKPLYSALKRSGKGLDSDEDGVITVEELQGISGTLILSGFHITDLSGLQSCTSIESLYLDHNSISDLEPISVLHQLKYLNISDNKVADLNSLYSLSKIKTLVANNNVISTINGTVTMRSLTHIYLDNNLISELTPLEQAGNVTHLSISNNNIISIQAIENMNGLEYLNLNNNQITELSPIMLCPSQPDLQLI